MSKLLLKGQKVDLTKGNPNLNKIMVGLGWDEAKYGVDFDLDVAVFMTGSDGKVTSDTDFIFYNNLVSNCSSVTHTGDNLTGDGDGDGDDEQIIIDLSKVPHKYNKLSFTITIHDASQRNQNFGQVANAYARVVDEYCTTSQELIRYDLGEDFSVETAIVACELYRHEQEWKFSAVGSGFAGGLFSLCKNFGVNV